MLAGALLSQGVSVVPEALQSLIWLLRCPSGKGTSGKQVGLLGLYKIESPSTWTKSDSMMAVSRAVPLSFTSTQILCCDLIGNRVRVGTIQLSQGHTGWGGPNPGRAVL